MENPTPIALISSSIVAVPALLAQVAGDPGMAIVKTISEASAVALLGWYMWYTVARALPAKDEAHRQETAVLRAEHREAQKETREAFAKELQEITQAMKDNTSSIRDSCRYRLGSGGTLQYIQPESKPPHGS